MKTDFHTWKNSLNFKVFKSPGNPTISFSLAADRAVKAGPAVHTLINHHRMLSVEFLSTSATLQNSESEAMFPSVAITTVRPQLIEAHKNFGQILSNSYLVPLGKIVKTYLMMDPILG